MKILYITNMYPTLSRPVFGIFVEEQINDISAILDWEHDLFFINGKENGKFKYLQSVFSIPRKIIKEKYDVIHIHYGLAALFLLFFKPRAKIFLTLHGSDILNKQGKTWQVYFTKKIVSKVDKVFILNDQMKKVVEPLNPNYEILPCGVNTKFFKPGAKTKTNNKEKIILFPGDPLTEVKNFPLFIEVFKYLSEKANYPVKYQTMSGLNREQVCDLLNSADCLLMTSFSEGSPQVVKEALSCGLPVVSVPVGDVENMLASIPNCYVSSSFDITELSKLVLLALAGDKTGIRETFIGKRIYDNDLIAKRIVKNYKDILQ